MCADVESIDDAQCMADNADVDVLETAIFWFSFLSVLNKIHNTYE